MKSLRDRPIREKLLIISMVTTAAALLLAGSGIILADTFLFRLSLSRDLSALGRIIADNTTAAVSFNDPEAAAQSLMTLRARPHVDVACIYRGDGTILAQYSPHAGFRCPAPPRQFSTQFDGMNLVSAQPILLQGQTIGTLVLIYNLGQIAERIRLFGAMVVGVLGLASILAFALSSSLRGAIATPISALVSATESVMRTGNYAIRAQKLSGDELGVLADRFNEMLAGIQSRDSELKKLLREVDEERERFHFLAESMPQKIFTATPSGEVDYFNRQWMEFTGLSMEQMMGWGWTQFVHPDDVQENVKAWKHSVTSGEPFQHEHRFQRADGRYRWHLSRARAMRDELGRITMWIGSNTDIHEQKEKEEELRRANEDLKQFAYSASHDLQEPIRNVAVYSEVIARRYANVLDDTGRQYLEFLREGGHRLTTLVSDLLAYTKASMAELSQSTVDASEALQNAIASLNQAIRETGAQVTWDPLPEVSMGEAHLQQIFQNLIANGLKYRNSEPPRVHVNATRRGNQWCFSVKDNGIGIDPQYKEKIFGLFKRLHHDQRYSGTGIGLAICQRVVERYGGRIWVESEPGKGATFFFTVHQHARPAASASVPSASGRG
jgi:PAS domain S-box-containing protein